MAAYGTTERLTERRLVHGWAAAPGFRVRQATAADLPAVGELVRLAGVRLEDELVAAVSDGTAGAALRAGLRAGHDGFTRHMAEQFIAHQERDQFVVFLHATLVLVAEHRERGVLGALIAYPPPGVVADYLDQANAAMAGPRERDQLWIAGVTGVSKIKAVALAESARGQDIGGSLLKRCGQVFFHCGYFILYGQMPPGSGPGLESFYQRHGFEVLGERAGLDMWVVFGAHTLVYPDPGKRMFVRCRPRR